MNRLYPDRPIAAVGGIIFRRDSVLLVKRGADPYQGRWSIPDGAIELGETAEGALEREVEEETGVKIVPLEVVNIYDSILEANGRVRYDYTIIDYLCRCVSGDSIPGSDVEDAHWISLADLRDYEMTTLALSAVMKAAGMRRLDED
ncbi:MAG: NUDIX hydrolase [Candidatus Thermoplasmatota archaeon]|nr:NUDIX hydrolase [Candidatus Thermoplasmatota archaeon]